MNIGFVDCVALLLNADAYPEVNKNSLAKIAEMYAAQHGYRGMLSMLIEHCINKERENLGDILRGKNTAGRDIMIYSAMGGKPDVITFLHERGASLNAAGADTQAVAQFDVERHE